MRIHSWRALSLTVSVLMSLGLYAQLDSVQFMNGTFYAEWHEVESDHLIVIIPGSGPIDRNGNAGGKGGNSLKYLADSLNLLGISTLNTDKYASAHSRIDTSLQIGYDDFIGLANEWLKKARASGYEDITLLGHSQGSLTALLLGDSTGVDRVISLCGAGRKINEVLVDQLTQQFPPSQMPPIQAAFDSIGMGLQPKSPNVFLNSMFAPQNVQFLISWAAHDPCEAIAKLNCPVAIIQGETDIQVTLKEANRLQDCQLEAEYLFIKGMGHMLKTAPGMRITALNYYDRPDLPLHPELAKTIVNFITSN